jgi:putative tricarboxylic transport membrane protein
MEEKLRQALILGRGDFLTFVANPVSAILLVIALGVVAVAVLPAIRERREEVLSG